MYAKPSKESPKPLNPFAAGVRIWSRDLEDFAKIPKRPPLMRDDHRDPDGLFFGAGDRDFDSEFFNERPDRDCRLVSASAGDRRRAGLGPLRQGYRSVRLSLRDVDSLHDRGPCVVFDVEVAESATLNGLTDDELHQLFWLHFDGALPEGEPT